MERKVKCKLYCGDAKEKMCCKFCDKRVVCGIACVNDGKCKGNKYINKDELSEK